MRRVVSVCSRQVPPLSLKRCRTTPLPLSTITRLPAVSNSRLRGLVRPPATSCACHPGWTAGRVYDGTRTLRQIWATTVDAERPAAMAALATPRDFMVG